MTHFADRLLELCRDKNAPVCVGIDPVYEKLPGAMPHMDPQTRLHIIEAYCMDVLEAVEAHVPAVKLQIACFERYRAEGMAHYFRLVERAHQLGLMVIADAKRGDIGTSSDHYAAGMLGNDDTDDVTDPDALTVNAYLGADAIEPFMTNAVEHDQGLFALVRTSNPGGDALQSLPLQDGRTVAEAVADIVAELGRSRPGYLGESGYSLLGAVVGATKAADAAALRKRMPQQLFLVPGFGAQGGRAEDVKACFKPDGTGAIITASRSVIYAYDGPDDMDWKSKVTAAAADLCTQIRHILS